MWRPCGHCQGGSLWRTAATGGREVLVLKVTSGSVLGSALRWQLPHFLLDSCQVEAPHRRPLRLVRADLLPIGSLIGKKNQIAVHRGWGSWRRLLLSDHQRSQVQTLCPPSCRPRRPGSYEVRVGPRPSVPWRAPSLGGKGHSG